MKGVFGRVTRQEIREMLAENRRVIDEIRALRIESERRWELDRERYEELSREHRDERQITREVLRRNELAFQGAQKAQAEMIAELRAQRQGFLALIDELRGGGPSPATS